jgi:hypothetical protein
MADIFNLGNPTGLNPIQDNALGTAGSRLGTDLKTGALRRKYNFGDRVSELALSQDPFFRFVSKVAKNPTDDPAFKFTEKRGSWHKRYAYVNTGGAAIGTAQGTVILPSVAGNQIFLKMGTDYASEGNKTNVMGKSVDHYIGGTGTKPTFFMQGQLVKIPLALADNSANASTYTDYLVVKVNSAVNSGEYVDLTCTVVKGVSASSAYFMHDPASVAVGGSSTTTASEEDLAQYKASVVGSAFAEGSGYPETWKDQPYGTGFGQTQIWKTSAAMTNTMRATSLKYEQNEWSRIWREKLIEHKYDIEQTMLFGSQYIDADGVQYTQGAVDWVTTYGNAFNLDIATKTADDFLDDMSAYLDPRYNNGKGTVFFCSTGVYNWLHKLGGYFKNNVEMSSNYRADMAITGKKKVMGIDITTISTPYGDMNVARNIHLDGTNVKILGINMSNCKYRPLVGNGINRDTSVYVGVQTLENSGIDRRVDLILTEAGMQWEMPESHAIWTA